MFSDGELIVKTFDYIRYENIQMNYTHTLLATFGVTGLTPGALYVL
jgi:hypothetical protein